MVEFKPCVTEIAMTRTQGTVRFLDGNKVYFTFLKRTRGNDEIGYGVIDISTSRKKYSEVLRSAFPTQPVKRTAKVYPEKIAYGIWYAYYFGLNDTDKDKTIMLSHDPITGKQWLSGYNKPHIVYNVSQCTDEDILSSWAMSKEVRDLIDVTIQRVTDGLAQQINSEFHPYRQLSDDETSKILGVLNFDGDKKSLVIGLKTAFGVDIKDSDVTVDKLLTKRITGILLEDLIG